MIEDTKIHIEEMIEKMSSRKWLRKDQKKSFCEAQTNAKEIRLGARQYADQLLASVENDLNQLLNTVKENRKELKSME